MSENPQHPIQGLSKATAEEEEEILDSLALLLSLQMLPCFSFSRHLQPYSHHSIALHYVYMPFPHTTNNFMGNLKRNLDYSFKLIYFLPSRIITSFYFDPLLKEICTHHLTYMITMYRLIIRKTRKKNTFDRSGSPP